MLSHRNLAWTARCLSDLGGGHSGDVSVSYLPLSHIAEQMCTVHGPTTVGSTVYFAESIEKLGEAIKEARPTMFFGVPRIWEKFHAGIGGEARRRDRRQEGAGRLGDEASRFPSTISALVTRAAPVPRLLAAQYRLAHRLVLGKLKAALGLDRARTMYSGAAPNAPDVLTFFSSLDLPVLEIYGQSEDSGPTSCNLPGKTKRGSVGPPLPGLEVKIAADGEILVRGPNVFLGYYKEPEATAEALVDGWLRSGDLGAFDADGFLSITGRKKEIIITAGGKNIAPKNIEAALKQSPLVAEAVVIGDRRKYLTVLVTLDEAAARKVAPSAGDGALHRAPEIISAIQVRVDAIRRWRASSRSRSSPCSRGRSASTPAS